MVMRRFPLIVVFALVLSLAAGWPMAPGRPLAADHTVGNGTPGSCTQTNLYNILDLGGSIDFNCGAAPASILIATQKLITTSASLDGGGLISLSGQNVTRLFNVQPGSTLTLTHMLLTKGFANADGGAIRVESGGALVIESSTFSDNHAGDAFSGGAIVSRGRLSIANSLFADNSAGNGGALNPRDGTSSTDIHNTLFQQNTTTNNTNGWGGALLVWIGAAVTVDNSQFISNTASSGDFSSSTIDRGGAVNVTGGSSLTVNHSQFAGNGAFFGGALYVAAGGSLTVTASNLHDNTISVFDGTQGGGAIYNAGQVLLDGDQLHDNHAEGGGGGLDNVSQAYALILNSVFRHNDADSGGAIENEGNATVITTTLADNSVTNYGGAIATTDENDATQALTVTAATLSGNSAGLSGGALFSEMRIVLTNVTLSANSGPETLNQWERPFTLTNVTLAQNLAPGLRLNDSPPLLLRNTLLAHNAGGNCAAPLAGTLLTSLSTDMTCFLLNGHDGVSQPLSPLGNHGGPTLTQMIAAGSPAQDHGGFCPATDQRGFSRTGPAAGLACDIGAVERQAGEPFGWVYLPLAKR
jgi:predicted outer membrane repeat protein